MTHPDKTLDERVDECERDLSLPRYPTHNQLYLAATCREHLPHIFAELRRLREAETSLRHCNDKNVELADRNKKACGEVLVAFKRAVGVEHQDASNAKRHGRLHVGVETVTHPDKTLDERVATQLSLSRQNHAAYLYQSASYWRNSMTRFVTCSSDMALMQQEEAARISRLDREARGVP